MKNYRNTFILFLVIFQSTAQFDYTKFSIKPTIGIGHNLRRPAEVTLGSDVMEVTNKSYTIGQLFNSPGNENFEFRTTNKIGISADFAINKELSFGVDLTRFTHLYSTISPVKWNSTPLKNTSWIDLIKFNSIGIHARKTWYGFQNNRFVEIGLGNTFKKKYPFENPGVDYDFIINGTGVYQQFINSNNPLFASVSGGISRKNGQFIPFRHELIIGINLPFTYLTKVSYNYQENNKLIGTNEIKFSQTALWFGIGFPIEIIRHRTKIINTPKEPKRIPEKEIKYEGKKINIGENIVLKNINFEQGSDVLKNNSLNELDKLVNLMKQYESINIIISGHTSNEGDRDANISLSKKRAESCKLYLRKEGIKSKRIETKGFGPDFPISNNNKELNRRVEFKIKN